MASRGAVDLWLRVQRGYADDPAADQPAGLDPARRQRAQPSGDRRRTGRPEGHAEAIAIFDVD